MRYLTLAALALAAAPSLSAQDFFGRDLSAASSATGNGSAAYVAPGSRTNSGAAFTAFQAALVGYTTGTIDFESLGLGSTPFTTGFSGSTGLWGGFGGNGNITNRNGNFGDGGETFQGRYSSTQATLDPLGQYFRNDGDYAIDIFGNAAGTIPGAASAFGFWGVDIGDVGQSLLIRFLSNGIEQHSFTILPNFPYDGIPTANDGNVLFYGFITNGFSFDRIEFESINGGDVFAFDDFQIGLLNDPPSSTVPEPATVGLLATGLLGILIAKRRNKRSIDS